MAPDNPTRTTGAAAGSGARAGAVGSARLPRVLASLTLLTVALLIGARSWASASAQPPAPGTPLQSPPALPCLLSPPHSPPHPPRWIRPPSPVTDGFRPECSRPLPGPIRS